MSTETEIKLYVANLDAVVTQLDAAQATLHTPRVFEKNWRYESPKADLTDNGIVLRLRQDNGGRITYKAPLATVSDAEFRSRLELETSIGDVTVMDDILQRLGFQVSMIYEKYRTTYHLGDAEIVLDEMPYGNFVEIEGTPEAIRTTLTKLDLDQAPRFHNSYVDLFEQVLDALALEFGDLTFDNFDGITVPPTVFHES